MTCHLYLLCAHLIGTEYGDAGRQHMHDPEMQHWASAVPASQSFHPTYPSKVFCTHILRIKMHLLGYFRGWQLHVLPGLEWFSPLPLRF